MFFYLITFLLCFFLDTNSLRKKQNAYIFCSLWMFCFLCFGYMCGSDWRSYERDYTQDTYDHYEIGSYLVFNVFKTLNVDFWVFTGFFKVLYLRALLSLASEFTEKKWSVIGIEFIIGSLLYMLISCPFRFMLATTMVLYAIVLFLKNRKLYALIFLLASCTFHLVFIVNVLLLLSYFVFGKLINRLSPLILIISYCLVFVIVRQSSIFSTIYTYLVPFFQFEEMAEGYRQDLMGNMLSLGNLKEFLLFLLIVLFRKDILKLKHGNILLYFALISSLLFILLKCIPVGSRFNIVNKFFLSIVFAELLYMKVLKPIVRPMCRVIMGVCCLVTFYNIYNDVVFVPYSNSIPYIIMGHKPMSERSDYNINAYHERTGKTYDPDDNSYK